MFALMAIKALCYGLVGMQLQRSAVVVWKPRFWSLIALVLAIDMLSHFLAGYIK